MNKRGSRINLLGLLLLTVTTRCRLFFNRGLLFPCVFYEQTSGKLLVLYGLQQEADYNEYFTVVPSGGKTPKNLKVSLNFCKMASKLNNTDLQTIGSSIISDGAEGKTYALSYSDGYLNSTTWSLYYNKDAQDVDILVIKGDNSWTGFQTQVIDPTFMIYCDQSVSTPGDFTKSLKMTSFTGGPLGSVTFEGKSKYACGFDTSFFKSSDKRFVYGAVATLGFLLLILGYCILKWTITLSLFLLGCCLAASEIFDNSTIGTWGKFAWIVFGFIILGLGFSLSYSGYYFPTGAIYLFAIYLGHLAATAVSDYFSIHDRFFVGYILVHLAFLIGSLAIFRKNLNNCKFCFTAMIGGWLLLFTYTNLRYQEAGLYLDGILKPADVFKLYPLSSVAVISLVVIGFFSQRSIFKSQAQQDGANAEVDEFMQQQ